MIRIRIRRWVMHYDHISRQQGKKSTRMCGCVRIYRIAVIITRRDFKI